jgi:hypothetical protein
MTITHFTLQAQVKLFLNIVFDNSPINKIETSVPIILEIIGVYKIKTDEIKELNIKLHGVWLFNDTDSPVEIKINYSNNDSYYFINDDKFLIVNEEYVKFKEPEQKIKKIIGTFNQNEQDYFSINNTFVGIKLGLSNLNINIDEGVDINSSELTARISYNGSTKYYLPIKKEKHSILFENPLLLERGNFTFYLNNYVGGNRHIHFTYDLVELE